MSPERVARAGYAGLMAGRNVVVPGFWNGVGAWLAGVSPRSFVLKVLGAGQRAMGFRVSP
jgi:uncharacterized protein